MVQFSNGDVFVELSSEDKEILDKAEKIVERFWNEMERDSLIVTHTKICDISLEDEYNVGSIWETYRVLGALKRSDNIEMR